MFKLFNKNEAETEDHGTGKVIAFMNQKGGVGKTSIAYNTAFALKERGHKVLCLDLDPQANLTSLFQASTPKYSLFQLMINSCRELKALHQDVFLADALKSTNRGVDYIGATQELSGFELTVAGINSPRQLILRKFIEKNELKKMYDYIVIDGPPTLGLLVVNILCACDGVLFPFIPDRFSEQGLKNIHEVLLDVEDMGISKTPKVIGHIPNLYEKRRKQSHDDLTKITETIGAGKMFEPLYNRSYFAKAMASGKSVFEYDSKDFRPLKEQFIDMAIEIEGQLQ